LPGWNNALDRMEADLDEHHRRVVDAKARLAGYEPRLGEVFPLQGELDGKLLQIADIEADLRGPVEDQRRSPHGRHLLVGQRRELPLAGALGKAPCVLPEKASIKSNCCSGISRNAGCAPSPGRSRGDTRPRAAGCYARSPARRRQELCLIGGIEKTETDRWCR